MANDERSNPFCRFDTLRQRCNQCQAHTPRTRIGAIDFTGQIRTWHHRYMFLREQITTERFVITLDVRPQVKTTVRALHIHDRA